MQILQRQQNCPNTAHKKAVKLPIANKRALVAGITHKFRLKTDFKRTSGKYQVQLQCFLSGQQIRISTGLEGNSKNFTAQKRLTII